jgi:cytoskeletal protein CcmA (bactofilin family)
MWFKRQTLAAQNQTDPYLGPVLRAPLRAPRQEPVFEETLPNTRPTTIDIDVGPNLAQTPKTVLHFQPKVVNPSPAHNPAQIVAHKPHTSKNTTPHIAQNIFIIPADVSIEGKIDAQKAMTIAGTLLGHISQCEQLILLSGGTIKGDITCHSAEISGTINGTINVTGLCVVHNSANITGPINYGTLKVDEGAIVNGTLTKLPQA